MSEATKNSSLPEADDDRRAVANGDDLFRILDRHEHDREHAAHVGQRAAHRVLQAVVAHFALDQVRDDFGVGLRLELVPLRLQLLLQLEVVLDDAVVDDDDAAGAVAVRVGVLLGGPAVRGPAGVADAVQAVDGLDANRVLEVRQLAGRPAQRDPFRADERHAGGVVAAVFHSAQSVQQDGHDGLRTDVSDDSAHRPDQFLLRVPLAVAVSSSLDPALDIGLPPARDAERAGRHVLGNRGAGRRRRRPCRCGPAR